MLFDTHCHINSFFYTDTSEIILRSRRAGVEFMLNAGTDIPSSKEAASLSQAHPGVLFSPGIHPHAAEKTSPEDLEELKKMAFSGKAAAVGETGLDFHYKEIPGAEQTALFRETITIAKKAGLPIIIHNREASDEVLAVLSKEYSGHEKRPNGVFHCFSENGRFARECIKLNFFISFAGNITYPKAKDLRLAVEEVPLESILIETDSPFLAPQAERGKKNEPSFIKHTAFEIAKIKKLPPEEIIRATGQNAARLFSLGA